MLKYICKKYSVFTHKTVGKEIYAIRITNNSQTSAIGSIGIEAPVYSDWSRLSYYYSSNLLLVPLVLAQPINDNHNDQTQ